MRDAETYCEQHDIKKCEFFEIAARDLLGYENAVPERLQDAAKSPTEEKLDEVLARLEGGAPLSSENANRGYNNNSGGGAEAAPVGGSGATHLSSERATGGDNNNPDTDEPTKPAAFDTLNEAGEPLSWPELKEVDEYVRSEDAWDELAIHPERIGETKAVRDPVITAAYGIIRWHVVEDERFGEWFADEAREGDAPDVQGVLWNVAPESASEHTLFERSGSRYPSYYRELTELLIPHPLHERWTTEEDAVVDRVECLMERDPADHPDWVYETDAGWRWADDIDSVKDAFWDAGLRAKDVGRKMETAEEVNDRMEEYVPLRMAVAWLDVAADHDITPTGDTNDVLECRAIYRQEAKHSGGHQALRETVRGCFSDLEVGDDYRWE